MLISIISGLISSILIIGISFIFGRYIQNRFQILIDNSFLAFGIGFSVYIAIITLAFMPVMFFAWSGTMLLAVWWVINILIIIFLAMKWRIINIKNIDSKQLYIFLIGGILLTIAWVYIGILPKSGDVIFYVPWVKSNQYTDHLNNYHVGNIYQGQGWYYFQTVLLRTTHMDQNFMNLWVFGAFLGYLTSSVMCGFVYTVTKKSNVFLMSGAIIVGLATQTFVNLGDYPNMGLTVFLWIIVLSFIIAINFIKSEQSNLLLLFSIITFAGWATLSSALFVIGALYISILFVLLFKKSKVLLSFLLINSIPILTMILILSFKSYSIIFILLSIFIPCWIVLIIWLFIWKPKLLEKWSIVLAKYKYWIFGSLLIIIISTSFCFWIIHGMDVWLNFSYRKDGLKIYIDNQILFIARYIIYWCFVIYLVYCLVKNLKNGIQDTPFNLFHLIVSFVVILFFNPLVASLWNGTIINNAVYYRMAFITLVPLYISSIIFISKTKLLSKLFKNTTYMLFVGAMTGSIAIPFIVRPFMLHNYSSYTGYSKGLPEVGKYITDNISKDKRMAGDVDGIFAYVDNPLSFARRSQNFDAFSYSILTNDFYDQLGPGDQNKIDILIKVKDNIAASWTPSKYGFTTVYLSNYELFIK